MDRWILSQFSTAGPEYFNCVAISQTPDPTGAYYRYAFSTGANFPDYPKYGLWTDSSPDHFHKFMRRLYADVRNYPHR